MISASTSSVSFFPGTAIRVNNPINLLFEGVQMYDAFLDLPPVATGLHSHASTPVPPPFTSFPSTTANLVTIFEHCCAWKFSIIPFLPCHSNGCFPLFLARLYCVMLTFTHYSEFVGYISLLVSPIYFSFLLFLVNFVSLRIKFMAKYLHLLPLP